MGEDTAVPLTTWKHPSQLTLWGGFKIPIVYWSNRKMRKELARDPTMSKQDLLGFWDGEKIVINKDEPVWDQIETLGHELVHATHDYAHWLKQHYVNPMKAEAGETYAHLSRVVEEDDDED